MVTMSMILSLLLPKAEPCTGDCHATPYSDHVLKIIINNTNVANFFSVYNQKHPKSPRDYNFRVAVEVPIFREVNFSPECKLTNILSDSDSHLDSDS